MLHSSAQEAGGALIAQAKWMAADLVVMGAYGRPRLDDALHRFVDHIRDSQ